MATPATRSASTPTTTSGTTIATTFTPPELVGSTGSPVDTAGGAAGGRRATRKRRPTAGTRHKRPTLARRPSTTACPLTRPLHQRQPQLRVELVGQGAVVLCRRYPLLH